MLRRAELKFLKLIYSKAVVPFVVFFCTQPTTLIIWGLWIGTYRGTWCLSEANGHQQQWGLWVCLFVWNVRVMDTIMCLETAVHSIVMCKGLALGAWVTENWHISTIWHKLVCPWRLHHCNAKSYTGQHCQWRKDNRKAKSHPVPSYCLNGNGSMKLATNNQLSLNDTRQRIVIVQISQNQGLKISLIFHGLPSPFPQQEMPAQHQH